MTNLEWPTARRKALVKHAAHYRHMTERGMGIDRLRLELSRIVIAQDVDKDGKPVNVYMLPHEIAAVVSYCYAFEPTAHDMHKA